MSKKSPVKGAPRISKTFGVKPYRKFSDKILWGSRMLNVDDMYEYTLGDRIKVAVLDTGCDLNHADLKDGIVASQSFVGGSAQDKNGHGTHVSGIIGARMNNKGIVGVAPKCHLYIGKVLNDKGRGSNKSIAQGIVWAAKKGCNVINLSLGAVNPSKEIAMAVATAYRYNKKCVIIAAAGNDGQKFPKTVNWPAALPEVISVGAVTKGSQWARFSSVGPNLDFVAPGHKVRSTFPGGYKYLSGTSMATPFVTGMVALIISHESLLSKELNVPFYEYIRNELKSRSTDLGSVGRDPRYGFGLIKFEDLK